MTGTMCAAIHIIVTFCIAVLEQADVHVNDCIRSESMTVRHDFLPQGFCPVLNFRKTTLNLAPTETCYETVGIWICSF